MQKNKIARGRLSAGGALAALLGTLAFTGPASAVSLQATLLPNGNGTTNQWTAAGAGTNWACVTRNDGDTSYVYTSAMGYKDSYQMEDLAAADSITAVTLYAYARKTVTQQIAWKLGLWSGGTEAQRDISDSATQWELYGGVTNGCYWTADPNTGSAWTLSGVNALQAEIVHNQSQNKSMYVTQVYLLVDYIRTTPTPSPTKTPTPSPTVTASPSPTPTSAVSPTPVGYKSPPPSPTRSATPVPTPSAPPSPSPAPTSVRSIRMDEIAWDVIGLDSNKVTDGPDFYCPGFRVTNTGFDTLTDVSAQWYWDSDQSNLINSTGLTRLVAPSPLAPGQQVNFYFNVVITRLDAAWWSKRPYHVTASAWNTATVSTPIGHQLYVEKLNSQNRNSVVSIEGPSLVNVGETYYFTLNSSTSTNGFENISTFINFPDSIFTVLTSSTTWSAATDGPNTTIDTFYGDGCGWDDDPASPTYNSCIGPCHPQASKLCKFGGVTTTYYVVKITGTGDANLTGLIYDFSGSSYHYNTDFCLDPSTGTCGVNTKSVKSVDPTKCFDVQMASLLSAQTGSTNLVSTGLQASCNMQTGGAAAVFCSFDAEAAATAMTGTWDIRLDNTWSTQTVQRYLSGTNDLSGASAIGIFDNLSFGRHTAVFRHRTSNSANQVVTRNANLVLFPLSNYGKTMWLNHTQATLSPPGATTASSNLSDVPGLSANITLDAKGKVFLAASLNGVSADATGKTGTWDITLNGVSTGSPVRKYLAGTNDLSAVTLVGLSAAYDPGTYSVKVRHATSAGTLRTAKGTLIAIALSDDGATGGTAINSYKAAFASQTAAAYIELTDISWSQGTLTLNGDDQVMVAASFTVEHGTGAGARTASHDLTVFSTETSVSRTLSTELSGTNDLTAAALFGMSTFETEGSHRTFLRHATSNATTPILTGDATIVSLGICCSDSPTAVGLKDFKATGYDSLIAVRWETSIENALGFLLHRSERLDGPYESLTGSALIYGASPTGGKYLVVDRNVENGRLYYYKLEEIGKDGASKFYGPESASPAASAGSFSYLPSDYAAVVETAAASETPTPLPAPTVEPTPPSASPTPPSASPTPPSASPTPQPLPTAYSLLPILASGDYDGDGLSEIAVFRPSTASWFIRDVTREIFGLPGDIPVSGDYDGDGVSEIAVFRPSTGFWGVKDVTRAHFGDPGDIPVPSDYDGDGTTGIAIFRPLGGLWAVREFSRSFFGAEGDSPVPGDYDGDGTADSAVFRSASALWAVRGITRVLWGEAGDLPVPGDYDGDGRTGIAVFRPSCGGWLIRNITRLCFGASGDCPAVGDYDGDGADEIAVFRPALGGWMIRELTRASLGTSGDIPVAK